MPGKIAYTTKYLEDEFKVTSFICMNLIQIINKMIKYVKEPDKRRDEMLERNLSFVKYEFKTLRILIKTLKNMDEREENHVIPQFQSLINPIVKNLGNIYREIKMPFTKNDLEIIHGIFHGRRIDIARYQLYYKLSYEYISELKRYF